MTSRGTPLKSQNNVIHTVYLILMELVLKYIKLKRILNWGIVEIRFSFYRNVIEMMSLL